MNENYRNFRKYFLTLFFGISFVVGYIWLTCEMGKYFPIIAIIMVIAGIAGAGAALWVAVED